MNIMMTVGDRLAKQFVTYNVDPNDIPKEIIHHAKQNELKVSDLKKAIETYNVEVIKIHESLSHLDLSHLRELKNKLSITSKKKFSRSELVNQLSLIHTGFQCSCRYLAILNQRNCRTPT